MVVVVVVYMDDEEDYNKHIVAADHTADSRRVTRFRQEIRIHPAASASFDWVGMVQMRIAASTKRLASVSLTCSTKGLWSRVDIWD